MHSSKHEREHGMDPDGGSMQHLESEARADAAMLKKRNIKQDDANRPAWNSHQRYDIAWKLISGESENGKRK